jgi:hypothetical protein
MKWFTLSLDDWLQTGLNEWVAMSLANTPNTLVCDYFKCEVDNARYCVTWVFVNGAYVPAVTACNILRQN